MNTSAPLLLQVAARPVAGTSGPVNRAALPEDTTLDEERREIVTSVLGALAGNPADPDEMAACSFLLKHLSQTVRKPVRAA